MTVITIFEPCHAKTGLEVLVTANVAELGEITGKTQVLYSELGEITGKTRVLPCGCAVNLSPIFETTCAICMAGSWVQSTKVLGLGTTH